ncbi:hypothetical protein HOV56_gp11 [Nitrosopumilus spindle-shaped virus]|uniref:Uncharacterized protein n=1 Tax=Nitrosopumilus spindle-shaped virus TaxID=2508184 RepID=A0A514K2P7_9VIRU|nr:hypothetical protein HOV56_gp11 [Nitrosopumilus spindle-shaped virus]QDI73900.1 hypothetical protein [Nitrosopumilus spindle-shaped virus]
MNKLKSIRYSHYCIRCTYEWFSTLLEPVRCASCRSPYWNKERKLETNLAN